VAPNARDDLGGAEWERAVIATVRRKGLRWRAAAVARASSRFGAGQLQVYDGKGAKHRMTVLSAVPVPELKQQLERLRRLHAADRAAAFQNAIRAAAHS
jgi:hypothetical protein